VIIQETVLLLTNLIHKIIKYIKDMVIIMY